MLPERVISAFRQRGSSSATAKLTYSSLLGIVSVLFLFDPWICTVFLVAGTLLLILMTVRPQTALVLAVAIEVLIAVLLPTYAVPGALRVGGYVLGILVAVCTLSRMKEPDHSQKNLSVVLLLSYFGVMTLGYAVNGRVSSLPINYLAICWAILLYFMLTKLDSHGRDLIARLTVGVMVVAVILAYGEMFANIPPLWGFLGSDQAASMRQNNLIASLPGRSVSFFGHPILFGLYCGITALIALTRPSHHRPKWYFQVAILGFALSGILLSGSRSPLIGMVAGLIVAYLYKNARTLLSRLASYVIGVSALTGFALFYVVPLVTSAAGSLSFEHRFGIVSSFMKIMNRGLLQNIFGSGPGAGRELFSQGTFAQTGLSVIDNQFIYTFISGGFLALIALTLFLYWAFVRGDYFTKGIVTLTVIMMFSFDTSSWGLSLVLMTMCAGFRSVNLKDKHQPSLVMSGQTV